MAGRTYWTPVAWLLLWCSAEMADSQDQNTSKEFPFTSLFSQEDEPCSINPVGIAGDLTIPQMPLPLLVQNDVLSREFVEKGETKQFLFMMGNEDLEGHYLNVAMTPCASPVYWTLQHRNKSNCGPLHKPKFPLKTLVSERADKPVFSSHPYAEQGGGLYTIQVTPLEGDTYVEIFLSLDREGGTFSKMNANAAHPKRVKFKAQSKKRELSAQWKKTNMDEDLHYCVVVNTRKFFNSICEARSQKINPNPAYYPSQDDILIKCTKKSSNFTRFGVQHGKRYFYNVFVRYPTNFTVPYAKGSILYEHLKPGLKDGKAVMGNIKVRGGNLTYRYKVSRRHLPGAANEILWYVVPCGGVVNVEILYGKQIVISKRGVFGYAKFVVANPTKGERYVAKITAASPEELQHFKHVEVMATMRPKLFPFPELPSELTVREYSNVEDCSTSSSVVTIGWLPLQTSGMVTYCVRVRKNKTIRSLQSTPPPFADQCHLDAKGMKERFVSIQCRDIKRNNTTEVIVQKLMNLKLDHEYRVQVTAKSHKKRTVSYDLLSVRKNNSCDK